MIFQTHDMIHPNQTRLNTLMNHYDRIYEMSLSAQPIDNFVQASNEVDLNDVIAFRMHYNKMV